MLLACVMVAPAAREDEAAALAVIAEVLSGSGFTVFTHEDRPISVELAVRCIQEAEQAGAFAAAVQRTTGIELHDIASQLTQRVWDSTYQEYSFYDSLRIAFGTFQGPEAYSELGTVYTFPFRDVLDRVGNSDTALTTRINIGSVGFVTADDGSYRVLRPGDNDWRSALDAIEQGRAGTIPETYRFVARDNNLAGVDSDMRLISWNAESTLPPARLFLQTRLLTELGRATRAAECEAE